MDDQTLGEVATLRLLSHGLSNRKIAENMEIHERTVAKYVGKILEKLHLSNRTQAALYAQRQGLEPQVYPEQKPEHD